MSFNDFLGPPNESQIQAIKAELGENSERFQNNLKLLEQWINCQSHLPKYYGENTLATYLRGCKNDIEKAKKKLEMFFVFKTKFPQLMSVRELSKDERAGLKATTMAIMPKLTKNGYRVIILKVTDSDPDLFDIDASLRCSWTVGQVRICKEHMIAGDIYIFDVANATPAHVLKSINLKSKISLRIFQESFITRLKACYIINSTSVVEKGINFMKMITKPKLRERIIADRGISCLKDIPKECLPKEYGGTEISPEEIMDKWSKLSIDNKEWLDNWEKVKLTGPVPKHIKDKVDFDDLQGIQGSFRKLEVD